MGTKTAKVIGEPMNRVDGKLKVTGAATYSTEYKVANAVYAVLVGSTIAGGSIAAIDTKAASNAPGVLKVVTHLNTIKVPGYQGQSGEPGQSQPAGRPLRVFYDEKVYFNGQPVAMVVATTFERARYAATLVKVTYKDVTATAVDFNKNKQNGVVPEQAKKNTKAATADYNRGSTGATSAAPVKLDAEYVQTSIFHTPMELHCITAIWETDDRLLLYAKVQGTQVTQQNFAKEWKLPPENIRVISPFVGGAFGSGLRNWPHETAAIIAAKMVNKPVKLVLTREQTIGLAGYRPHTWQKISMGATTDGKLVGITHEAVGQTSSYEQFTEGTLQQSRTLYNFPNVKTTYRILPLNVSTPAPMRGPGEATGAWALECAMDEMAHQLNMDPIEFRLNNLPEKDPDNDKPWSSNYVKECWQQGAEAIGWKNRKQQPGTSLDGDWQVGYGVATGIFGANRQSAKVRGKLYGDGSVLMQCAVTDIGPGTGTALTQIAMENLSLPVEKVTFQWGNSDFPEMGNQGGSSTINSVGPAVVAACNAIKGKLLEMAGNKKPEFKNLMPGDVVWDGGKIITQDKSISYSFEDVLKDAGAKDIDVIES
ncbi:MAG: xanthine dehydrogenase family protein molybdopterin-binding subunit, partial [Mucilaginibacter polytrichastri]|nr:xanthine dehydrogenase family protein molybdopterin-binding subunit [Mucilaginibacter polytrichastri]